MNLPALLLIAALFPGRAHGATVEDRLAAIEKRLDAIEKSLAAKPAAAKASAAPRKVAKGAGPIDVSLLEKGFAPLDVMAGMGSARITFKMEFANKTEKEIRAFTGKLSFLDLFDRPIVASNLTVEKGLPAKDRVEWEGGFDYNQFRDSDRTLRAKSADDLRVTFDVEQVIFADGTRQNFKK